MNTQFATVRFLSFSFFGLFITCTGRTVGPILTIYTSHDIFPCKNMPFGGSVNIPPHLVGQISTVILENEVEHS